MIDIWKHLRKLRRELRDAPLLQQVTFRFLDNRIAAWTREGKARDSMHKECKESVPSCVGI